MLSFRLSASLLQASGLLVLSSVLPIDAYPSLKPRNSPSTPPPVTVPCKEVAVGLPLYIGTREAQAVDQPIELEGVIPANSPNSVIETFSNTDVNSGTHFYLKWSLNDRKVIMQNSSNGKKRYKYVYKVSDDFDQHPGPIISDTVKWYYLFDDDTCQTKMTLNPKYVVVQRIEVM